MQDYLRLNQHNQILHLHLKLKQKELEYIKIREWEEKFDREQKAKEHRENLREQRLKQKELEKLGAFEEKENDMSSALEKFNIDKTKEH